MAKTMNQGMSPMKVTRNAQPVQFTGVNHMASLYPNYETIAPHHMGINQGFVNQGTTPAKTTSAPAPGQPAKTGAVTGDTVSGFVQMPTVVNSR